MCIIEAKVLMAAHKGAGISGRRGRRQRQKRSSYWQRIIKYNCHKTLSFCLAKIDVGSS